MGNRSEGQEAESTPNREAQDPHVYYADPGEEIALVTWAGDGSLVVRVSSQCIHPTGSPGGPFGGPYHFPMAPSLLWPGHGPDSWNQNTAPSPL